MGYNPWGMAWFGPWVRALCVAVLVLGAAGCIKDFEVPDRNTPGGKAYVQRCSLCHALPDPTRMTFAQWAPVVGRMAAIIRSQNVPQISDEELAMILRYLKAHAKNGPVRDGDAPARPEAPDAG
jgi:hypothetical protein